jgi:hypothetical protein
LAIAHKLLVSVWHVLSRHEIDRRGDPNTISRSMLERGWMNHLAALAGLRLAEFTHIEMGRLGIRPKKVVYSGRMIQMPNSQAGA